MAANDAASGVTPEAASESSNDDVQVSSTVGEGRDSVEDSASPDRTTTSRTFVAPPTRTGKNRGLLLIGVAVFVVAAVVGGVFIATNGSGSKTPKTPPSFVAFHDPTTGLGIAYPAGWTQVQSTDPTVRLTLGFTGPADLDLLRVRIEPTQALVGSSSTNVEALKAFTNSIVSGSPVIVQPGYPRSVTINGLPGYYYLYTFTDTASGQPLVHAHYFLFQGHNMITLVFQSLRADFARLAPTFDQVTATLRSASVASTTPPTT